MKKYPFFICVDDGGFPFVEDDISPPQNPIPFSTYETLAKIAREFNMRMPLALTLKYFDIKNISGVGNPVSYAKKLIKFLEKNHDFIEVAYHGLTHNYQGKAGEFSQRVPESVQLDHLEKSKEILDSLGWPFPEIFIPPYHLWQKGVTDKILKEFGCRYILTNWKVKSDYLQVFPRGNMGIYSDSTTIQEKELKRVSSYIVPTNLFFNIRYHHRLKNQPFHSYITHIGNFDPSSLPFWFKLIEKIKTRKDLRLVKNNIEAVSPIYHDQ